MEIAAATVVRRWGCCWMKTRSSSSTGEAAVAERRVGWWSMN
jgi:hypothetical protein